MQYLILALFSVSLFADQVVKNPFETVRPEEGAQVRGLAAGIKSGLKKSRDAHAKAHGCVAGAKVTVAFENNEMPRVGFFADEGKVYDAVIRFSSGSGNPAVNDAEGGPQGLALKILLNEDDQKKLVPVFGEKEHFVPEKYYRSFDIITISPGHEFFIETIADYPAFFAAAGKSAAAAKAAAEETLKNGGSPEEAGKAAKVAGAKVLAENYFAPAGGKQRPREAAILATLSAARPKNVLQQTYGSWVPSLYGKNAAKYEIAPCEEVNPAKYEFPTEVGDVAKNPNYLADVLKYELAQKDHCFQLKVQIRQDDFSSVEDPVAVWPTEKSQYKKVAEIRIPKKQKGDEFIDSELCESMSFHPGHASSRHYPLGGIQRARVGGIDKDGPYEGIYTVIHRERNLNAGRKPLK